MTVERKPSVMGAVLGDYRITGALGGGGMGAVFSATHATTGAPAAVKLLRKELTDNKELVERFFNEARAATRIQHPGIIEVYDFGFTDAGSDGRAFLVMELLEGMTLRARIDHRKRLPEAEAVAIARGIADALAAAHGAGIIHRDLKPDNVFLVGGDRVKLLDFGIAKLLDRSADEASRTRTGSLMGTPVYMAPEQARAAGAIDPRADLYSLGCILYEMVTGAPPFTGNVGELLAAHMFTEPVPARDHAPISAALDALIARLLAKAPADRPRDAQAVVAALDASSAPAVRRGFDDAPPAMLDEKRSAMPIIAAVATLAIAGAALFFVFGRGAAADDPPAAPVSPAKAIAADPAPVVVTPVPVPTVTPLPTPPGPAPVVVVKKPPVVVKRPVDHPPVDHTSSGPITMPEARTEPPPAKPTGPLVTPEGAPLSGAP